MTDYTWPSAVKPQSCNLTWNDNSVPFRSPFSGTVRTQTRPGGHWLLQVIVQPRAIVGTSISDPTIEAFLFRLNGLEHRAIIPDFAYQRAGAGGGSPVVNGAGQTGKSLNTSGWPTSTTVLLAGDRIGTSDQMIPVVADVTSDGSGLATISLAHSIRTAPSNGSAIEIDAPTARFMLRNQVSFAARPGIVKSTLIEFEEDIL